MQPAYRKLVLAVTLLTPLVYNLCTEKPESIYKALDVVISTSCAFRIQRIFEAVLQFITAK